MWKQPTAIDDQIDTIKWATSTEKAISRLEDVPSQGRSKLMLSTSDECPWCGMPSWASSDGQCYSFTSTTWSSCSFIWYAISTLPVTSSVHLFLLQCSSSFFSSTWWLVSKHSSTRFRVEKACVLLRQRRVVCRCPSVWSPVLRHYSSSRKQTRKTHFRELIQCPLRGGKSMRSNIIIRTALDRSNRRCFVSFLVNCVPLCHCWALSQEEIASYLASSFSRLFVYANTTVQLNWHQLLSFAINIEPKSVLCLQWSEAPITPVPLLHFRLHFVPTLSRSLFCIFTKRECHLKLKPEVVFSCKIGIFKSALANNSVTHWLILNSFASQSQWRMAFVRVTPQVSSLFASLSRPMFVFVCCCVTAIQLVPFAIICPFIRLSDKILLSAVRIKRKAVIL